MSNLTRRMALSRLGAAGLAGAAAGGFARAPQAEEVIKTLDFTKPEDNLIGIVKMSGSLEPQDVPHWYYGTIYGLVDGEAPKPLFDLEGSEISYFVRNDDGSFRAYSSTISIFRDLETRQVMQTFENPYTGKTNDVQPNYIKSDGRYYHYSVNGIKISSALEQTPDRPLLLKWSDFGVQTLVQMERSYPPGFILGEAQSVHGPTADLHNPDLTKVSEVYGSPTYMAPWPFWMDMKDHPGRVIWHVNAIKTETVKDYPAEFLGILERDYPEKLTAKPA